MKIAALEKFRGRNQKGYFRDLTEEQRHVAYLWLHRFVSRWGRDLPPWRFAILVGQAKRLAVNPSSSAWGRSMLAKRGGLAVQRKYLIEGKHPTQQATQARLAKQKRKKTGEHSEPAEKLRIVHLPLWD